MPTKFPWSLPKEIPTWMFFCFEGNSFYITARPPAESGGTKSHEIQHEGIDHLDLAGVTKTKKNLWGILFLCSCPGPVFVREMWDNFEVPKFPFKFKSLGNWLGFFGWPMTLTGCLVIPTWWNTEGFLLEVASISLLSFESPDSNVSSNYGNNLGKQVKHYGYISNSDSAADWWLGNLAPKWSFHHTKTFQLPLSGRKCPAWKRLLMKSIAAVEPATCTRT